MSNSPVNHLHPVYHLRHDRCPVGFVGQGTGSSLPLVCFFYVGEDAGIMSPSIPTGQLWEDKSLFKGFGMLKSSKSHLNLKDPFTTRIFCLFSFGNYMHHSFLVFVTFSMYFLQKTLTYKHLFHPSSKPSKAYSSLRRRIKEQKRVVLGRF